MAIINKTGITNGGTIQAEHVTRAIDALSGGSTDTIVATGSFSGSLVGALTGTASFATSASRAVSASFATSASRSTSSSFATTASFALNAGAGAINEFSLQFTHGTWITASTTPYYYGNYGSTQPFSSINRIGVAAPKAGTLVTASIAAFNENPGGSTKLSFWAVKDGQGTPVSKSISSGVVDTDSYFTSDTYVLNPADLSPFTVAFGDMLSIKIQSAGTVNGLDANTTVTLIFRV